MKPHNPTVGLAAVASVALMLTVAACGDSKNSISSPTPVAAPAPAATFAVSGTVSEATESGSAPIEGATIAIADTENWVVSDAEGFYRLSGLRTGTARFIVSKTGYEELAVEMMIEGDAHLDAVLVRQPS